MELERLKRVLATTSSDLADCLAHTPSPLLVDVQLVVDGMAICLLLWSLGRFAWDVTHRRPDIFPLDR